MFPEGPFEHQLSASELALTRLVISFGLVRGLSDRKQTFHATTADFPTEKDNSTYLITAGN